MTSSLAGRSEYAAGLSGLLLTVALSPLWAVGCSDDPTQHATNLIEADAGAPVESSCTDGIKSGAESDVDCGGSCKPCDDSKLCKVDADCVNGACVAGFCRSPACDDGRKNGTETDLDCGGGCDPCELRMACVAGTDCASGLCGAHAKCIPATCGDGQKNGFESDLDCGGMCAPCVATKACRTETDCQSGVCASGTCQAPACDDGVVNGDETDLDCGGSCNEKCAEEKKCNLGEHCATGICSAPRWGDTTRRCRAPGCYNYAKDSGETDIDCGGPCDTKCQTGQSCLVGGDCWSLVCDSATGKCLNPTCSDGVQNGGESDIDCGSACPCAPGRRCTWDGECDSTVCDEDAQTCLAPTCSDGVRNGDETDADCGGSCATPCNNGQHCMANSDCASGHCMGDHCMP